MNKIAVVIVAAGRGTRFGSNCPKQYHALAGQSILARTLTQFLSHSLICDVITVIHPHDHALYQQATSALKIPHLTRFHKPVEGGATRQESVYNGLAYFAALPKEQQPDHVLIHDGARPLISHQSINRLIETLQDVPAAITAIPLADTLKYSENTSPQPIIQKTIDRNNLWRAQTPQGFNFETIWSAHQRAQHKLQSDFTDDAAVVEAAGHKVHLVSGDEQNFKITTKDDIYRAEHFLNNQSQALIVMEPRIGKGFDVHRLGPGTDITLCGVCLPHDQTLIGHSDADVGLHALVDALLGAIGMGDIGQHFPPTDEQWKGVDSGKFVSHAVSLIAACGARILNVDVTLMCERPKIVPYRDVMRQRMADLLDISSDRVNMKATTTERLGFTGRGEGIAAEAIALVSVPLSSKTSLS